MTAKEALAALVTKLGGTPTGKERSKADYIEMLPDLVEGAESSYVLPTAAADTLGGVKVGTGLTITDGVLSVDAATVAAAIAALEPASGTE